MKSILLFLAIGMLLPVCLVEAQSKQHPDSIRVEIPDHQSFMIFEMRDYVRDKDLIRNFPSSLRKLIDHVSKSIAQSDLGKPHVIEVSYSDDKEKQDQYTVRIYEPEVPATTLTVRKDAVTQLLPQGWEISIHHKKMMASVYAPDFERLRKLPEVYLEPVITQLDSDADTRNQTRQGFISRIILSNGTATPTKTEHRYVRDMLELSAGAGAGLIIDRFYAEANLSTALHLSNRYRDSHQRFEVSYEMKLFSGRRSESSYYYTPASFLNLSWALNFAKERPRWTGLGVGYLVHNKSDLFNGRTIKVFLLSDIGSSKLNLVPELYLTDDLKKSIFGLKLNYKF
jgi:hypothetical protein